MQPLQEEGRLPGLIGLFLIGGGSSSGVGEESDGSASGAGLLGIQLYLEACPDI